jgi:Uma2 family endonuclease
MSTATLPQIEMTVEELAARVGPVPLWRVRTDPSPGTATEEDVERIRRDEGRLCEIIDGVLVEKAVSNKTSYLAMRIGALLCQFVEAAQLGWVLGADGFVWLLGTHLRAPDVSFFRRDQMPGGELPETGYADVAPALAVEVVSPGNTPREMEQKREIFFAAGTELFWIVFPDRREVEVWSDPRTHRVLSGDEVLDGGSVLPGFSVPVSHCSRT